MTIFNTKAIEAFLKHPWVQRLLDLFQVAAWVYVYLNARDVKNGIEVEQVDNFNRLMTVYISVWVFHFICFRLEEMTLWEWVEMGLMIPGLWLVVTTPEVVTTKMTMTNIPGQSGTIMQSAAGLVVVNTLQTKFGSITLSGLIFVGLEKAKGLFQRDSSEDSDSASQAAAEKSDSEESVGIFARIRNFRNRGQDIMSEDVFVRVGRKVWALIRIIAARLRSLWPFGADAGKDEESELVTVPASKSDEAKPQPQRAAAQPPKADRPNANGSGQSSRPARRMPSLPSSSEGTKPENQQGLNRSQSHGTNGNNGNGNKSNADNQPHSSHPRSTSRSKPVQSSIGSGVKVDFPLVVGARRDEAKAVELAEAIKASGKAGEISGKFNLDDDLKTGLEAGDVKAVKKVVDNTDIQPRDLIAIINS